MSTSLQQKIDEEPTVIELTAGRWVGTLKDHVLMGATFPQLVRILRPTIREIDVGVFAIRLLFLLVVSLFNSIFALVEFLLYYNAVRKAKIIPKPLIIVGLPRSGTTLLHNMLSLDEQFITPTTARVGFPSSFLSMEKLTGYWPLNSMLSKTRPMDNMQLAWNSSQEDEIATNILSGGASPYMAIHFMRIYRRFNRYITFKDPRMLKDFERWREGFMYFLRKLSYRARPGQRLLLKSPVHLGRVGLLNLLFKGDVQFVFIHRNPYDLFQSSCAALGDKYIRPCASLQTFDAAHYQRYTLETNLIMHGNFIEDKNALKPGQLSIVAFDDLVNKTEATVKRVYKELGMPLNKVTRGKLKTQDRENKQFQRNHFEPLSEAARGVVRRVWGRMFDELGYSP